MNVNVPGSFLPDLDMGTMSIDQAKFKVKSCSFLHRKEVEAPDAGYRYLYVDELQNNPQLKKKMVEFLSKWAIIQLINGWTEGAGYGAKVVKDMG